jgi:omega-6 fatty acid desaturase (delta-12 desaturase)
MIASILGAYLFYAQHNFPSVDLCEKSEWNYCYAALRSSSFMDTTRLMHWITGNIGYHHVHHLNARIPFYRLPETMAALPELQSPGRTALNPKAIRACFRLKLWDESKRRMVSFNGT